jgi:hypothetical protein
MHKTSTSDTSITDPEAVVAVYNTHSEAEVEKAKAILQTTRPAGLDEHALASAKPSAA